jgi:hypothetical protein
MTHAPVPVKLTTPEAIEQAPASDVGSTESSGAKPEVDVTFGVYVGPSTVALGGTELKVRDWLVGITVTDCDWVGAGRKLLSPAWLASRVHVPAPVNWTTL